MLSKLSMISVSWRQGGSESLAGFRLADSVAADRLAAFARDFKLAELAYLVTCNRVELLVVRGGETPELDLREHAFELLSGRASQPGEARRRLRAWQGEGAAEHLFLVAAGLDSACVGEVEIVGQVRACYAAASRQGLCGRVLTIAFEEALRIAAKVRDETGIGTGRVSLAEIAVDLLRERIQRTPGKVALVGVSPMTERAATSVRSAAIPMVVVNRTLSKAAALAARVDGEAVSLENFLEDPPAIEAVLCATGAAHAIFERNDLERLAARTASGEAPLIIDMAIPPNVDPLDCAKLGIPRIGMDEITLRAEHNRANRIKEAAQARELVDNALMSLRDRFIDKTYGQLLGTLQKRYQRTAQEGVQRLLKKDLKGLGPAERSAIEAWCDVLARRFAHIPCLGLRGLLYTGPDGSVEAFIDGLDEEFAQELRAAMLGPD